MNGSRQGYVAPAGVLGAMRCMVIGALVLLVLVPAAAAETYEYRFSQVARADFSTSGATAPAQAADLRGTADFDEDGSVSPAEAETMERAAREGVKETGENPRTSLDGKGPASVDVSFLALEGLVGPTDSTAPLFVKVRATVSYPLAEGTHVWQRFTNDADEGRTYRIVAPPGFVVGEVVGLDGAVSGEELAVGVASVGGDIRVVFIEADTSAGESPGAGVVALLVLLVGLLSGIHKSRRQ